MIEMISYLYEPDLSEFLSDEILATVTVDRLTDWIISKFLVESKINEILGKLERVTIKERNLSIVEIQEFLIFCNEKFEKTPFLFTYEMAPKGMYVKLLRKMKYIWTIPNIKIKLKTKEQMLEHLVENPDFQPVTEDAEWNGSKKAIMIFLTPFINKTLVKANKGKFFREFRSLLAHELIHNYQYLARLNLAWRDTLNQSLSSYEGTDDYFLRKDEIAAYAMHVVEAYQLGIRDIYIHIIHRMKEKGKEHVRAWRKFVNNIFNILRLQNKSSDYILRMANEIGLATKIELLDKMNQIEIVKLLKDYEE